MSGCTVGHCLRSLMNFSALWMPWFHSERSRNALHLAVGAVAALTHGDARDLVRDVGEEGDQAGLHLGTLRAGTGSRQASSAQGME